MPSSVRDHVPWDRLWVYGAKDARGVPKLVRRIGQLRGSRRVRGEAFAALESCLEHQGGLSPATVHVIPRLFAILGERPGRPWQREALLALLSLFAVPACADPEIARACFLAVEEGAPSITHMIQDPSDRVACAAIGLLSLFRRHAEATIAALPHTGRSPAVITCANAARERLSVARGRGA